MKSPTFIPKLSTSSLELTFSSSLIIIVSLFLSLVARACPYVWVDEYLKTTVPLISPFFLVIIVQF